MELAGGIKKVTTGLPVAANMKDHWASPWHHQTDPFQIELDKKARSKP
jgi:hypothetical protein